MNSTAELNASKSATSPAIIYLFLIATMAIWGSLYVVTRIALMTIPPITLLAARYVLAFLVFLALLARRRARGEKSRVEKADYPTLVAIGAVGYFFGVCVQILGTKLAGASVASMVNAMNPICITVFAGLLLHEKISARKIVALLIAVAGAMIVLGGAQSGAMVWGVLLSLLSVILWSLSSVLVRKFNGKYDPVTLTSYCLGVAVIFCLPSSAVELAIVRPAGLFSFTNLWCVLYLGIVCTALPNFLWNKSLSVLEASTCSLFYPLQPLMSVILGMIFLGEELNARFILGGFLIVAAVIFALVGGTGKHVVSESIKA